MSNLKEQLIRLGSTTPELQPHIRPVLDEINKRASSPYRHHPVGNLMDLMEKNFSKAGRDTGNLYDLVDALSYQTGGEDASVHRDVVQLYAKLKDAKQAVDEAEAMFNRLRRKF